MGIKSADRLLEVMHCVIVIRVIAVLVGLLERQQAQCVVRHPCGRRLLESPVALLGGFAEPPVLGEQDAEIRPDRNARLNRKRASVIRFRLRCLPVAVHDVAEQAADGRAVGPRLIEFHELALGFR